MNITKGIQTCAQKVLVYGPEGIGKSSFAAKFPDPLFIDTEGSTKQLDVARLDAPTSWAMLVDEVSEVKKHPDCCKTLVIDTADWAEMLCIEHVCAIHNQKGLESFGYGKGYTYLAEEFGRLLNRLSDLVDIGINVVFCAHATIKKFELPDETGAYDRFELKLQRKTAPLLKEWADMVLFANYKTITVKQDNKVKAAGGRRVMYAAHHVCWDAKNRHGLPDEMEFDFAAISRVFAFAGAASTAIDQDVNTPQVVPSAPLPPKKDQSAAKPAQVKPLNTAVFQPVTPDHLVPLYDLMARDGVTEAEVQATVATKKYFPIDTPIENYPTDFVAGVLIGAWDKVKAMVEQNRPYANEIPF